LCRTDELRRSRFFNSVFVMLTFIDSPLSSAREFEHMHWSACSQSVTFRIKFRRTLRIN
ncbi:hypothetical protein CSKR_203365, partial [Clonorchis sinensis]